MRSKLRFAALVRVSTEKQAKVGESLRTQSKQTTDAVRKLNGTVVQTYGGQEHATPGWEKAEVERLLADAQKGLFDAVIVAHEDRWSRDNESSKRGLRILREKGIRFFTLNGEHDLHNPTAMLVLGMSAEIGEYQAKTQNIKSTANRIERAGRVGAPTCGKQPFGRIWDKDSQKWEVDPVKKRQIVTVARKYLKGASMVQLAKDLGVNHASLHKTLTKRCGEQWTQHFKTKDGVVEILTTIPALLDEQTIERVLQRVKSNRTFTHGQPSKHKYLLGRMIFCGHCGYAMFGQTNHNVRRYYRHAHTARCVSCNVAKGWVPADAIEEQVVDLLFETFGNPIALQAAIEAAIPNRDKVEAIRIEVEQLNVELAKIEKARDRILALIGKETITDKQADRQLIELKSRESKLTADRDRLQQSIDNVLTSEQIEQRVRIWKGHPLASSKQAVKRREAEGTKPTTFKEQRGLCEIAFAGERADGRRNGVYVFWQDGNWKFEVFGELLADVTNSATCSRGPAPRAHRFCGQSLPPAA